jgi:hypothetical protein
VFLFVFQFDETCGILDEFLVSEKAQDNMLSVITGYLADFKAKELLTVARWLKSLERLPGERLATFITATTRAQARNHLWPLLWTMMPDGFDIRNTTQEILCLQIKYPDLVDLLCDDDSDESNSDD